MAQTIQSQVERLMARGETSGAAIARALGIRREYARACMRRARLFAATGRKWTAQDAAKCAARKRDLLALRREAETRGMSR